MFDTRLCLLDGVHNEVVECTCCCCDGNIVLLWDGPKVPKTALYNILGTRTSRPNRTYMESVDAASALQLSEAVQHAVLGSACSLGSPGFFYLLPGRRRLLSVLLKFLLCVL